MAILKLLCLSACFSLLAIASLEDQSILNSDFGDDIYRSGGLLRRFQVRNSQDIENVLLLAKDHELDVWQVARSHVDIYSPPESPLLPPSLQGFPHTQKNIPHQSLPLRTASDPTEWGLLSLANTTFHSIYHPLYEIDNFMHEIAALHPEIVSVVHLGHSGEGREMLGLTLSRPPAAESPQNVTKGKYGGHRKQTLGKKLGFVISGAQHAREWVATAASLYLTHALLSNSSEPHSLSHLLDTFDFHIIPAPNPDGYDYTWGGGRFWYKNRMVLGPNAECVGIDMNRNWGYKWDPYAYDVQVVNASTKARHPPTAHPCSNWYPGHRPFEAPEVNNIANFVSRLPNLEAFIDLRSYGQMLTPPYSFSCDKVPKDAEDMLEAALGAAQALHQVHGTQFQTGSLCSMLYRAPGNIVDWMYARAGIKYSYAAHLRDTGTYGFSLPAEWIRPVGEETAKMIEYLAHFISKNQK
jgi:extracellular matrix protein 14